MSTQRPISIYRQTFGNVEVYCKRENGPGIKKCDLRAVPSGEERNRLSPRNHESHALLTDDRYSEWAYSVVSVAMDRYAGCEHSRRSKPKRAVHTADEALRIVLAMSLQEINKNLAFEHNIDKAEDEAGARAYLDRPDVREAIERVWAENVRLWDEEMSYIKTLPDQEGPIWRALPNREALFVYDEEG